MRCPKCSTAFVVEKPASPTATSSAVDTEPAIRTAPVAPAAPDKPLPKLVTNPKVEGGIAAGTAPIAPPRPIRHAPGPTEAANPPDARLKPPPPRRATPDDESALPSLVHGGDRLGPGAAPRPPAPSTINQTTANAPTAQAQRELTPPRRPEAVTLKLPIDELDLPNLRSTVPPPSLESDLPAALGPRPPRPAIAVSDSLPSPTRRNDDAPLSFDTGGIATDDEWDLPEMVHPPQQAAPRRTSDLELDLPASKQAALPAKLATPTREAKSATESDDFEFDLPSPVQNQRGAKSSGDARPSPARSSTMPGGFDLPDLIESGLPQVSHDSIGLPSLPGQPSTTKKTLAGPHSSLPPSATSETSRAIAAAAPLELDLGLDMSYAGADSSLPPPRPFDSAIPSIAGPIDEISVPPARATLGRSDNQFEHFTSGGDSALGPRAAAGFGVGAKSKAAGSTDYGEVSLESGQDLPVETETAARGRSMSGEVLEFGGVPQAVDAQDTSGSRQLAPTPAAAATILTTPQPHTPRFAARPSRRGWLMLSGVVLATMGGASLTLWPDIGPFGVHFIADQMNKKQNDALVLHQVDLGRKALAADDYSGVDGVLSGLEAVRRDHERLRVLKAYSAYFIYAIELRHAGQPQNRARAKVMLDELGERTDIPFVVLADAARAAVEGNLAKARRLVELETARDPRHVDARVLSAEIGLLERRMPEALDAWQTVGKLES
ncbi:MAG TPA: hypothetical protein VIV60_34155, partial [Polyangiaceae bacterium]